MKYIIVFLFLITFVSVAKAGGLNEKQIVNHLQFYQGHVGLLVRQSSLSNPDGCSRQDYYILKDTHKHFSEMYSLILAAHFSGHKLSFYVDGCTQGMPTVVNVYSNK